MGSIEMYRPAIQTWDRLMDKDNFVATPIPSSWIEAYMTPALDFIQQPVTNEQSESINHIYIHDFCIDSLASHAKIEALFPEYVQYLPKRRYTPGDSEIYDDSGYFSRVKHNREAVLKAIFAKQGLVRHIGTRFKHDAEVMLCQAIAHDFSFFEFSYLEPKKYSFLWHVIDGRTCLWNNVEPIRKLYEIVQAERPVIAFYENHIRPLLALPILDRSTCSVAYEQYKTVRTLQNYESIIQANVNYEWENDDYDKKYRNVQKMFFAMGLDLELSTKDSEPKKKSKI